MAPILPKDGHERPEIFMEPEVYFKIMHLIWACDTEVNGLARVERIAGKYHINDVAVLKQYVSGGYAEHDTNAILDFMLEKGDDAPNWICQWHSHVNMETFWSGQDEEAVAAMGDTAEWTISIVFNKKQSYKARIDIFKPVHVKNIDCTLTINKEIPDYSEWAQEIKKAVVFLQHEKPAKKRDKNWPKTTTQLLLPHNGRVVNNGKSILERHNNEITEYQKYQNSTLPLDTRGFITYEEEEELRLWLGCTYKDMDALLPKEKDKFIAYKEMLADPDFVSDQYTDWMDKYNEENGGEGAGSIVLPTKREAVALQMGESAFPDDTGTVLSEFTDEEIDDLYYKYFPVGEEIDLDIPDSSTPWDDEPNTKVEEESEVEVTDAMWNEVISVYGTTRDGLMDSGVNESEVAYIYYNELHPELRKAVKIGKTAKKRVKKFKKSATTKE